MRIKGLREVRVIDNEGKQLGVFPLREAIVLAQEKDLDLVLIAPQADPPVCRIVDHGRFKYEQEKLKKDQKRKQQDVKGIKLRPNTAEHDLMVLVRSAQKFLQEGDKVRVVCLFRQRELAHPEVGQRKLDYIAEQLADVGKVEAAPRQNGREMVIVISPKPQGGDKKKKESTDAQAQDEQNGG